MQYWYKLIVNWTASNLINQNVNKETNISFKKMNMTFENAICKMPAILSQPQCVKDRNYSVDVSENIDLDGVSEYGWGWRNNHKSGRTTRHTNDTLKIHLILWSLNKMATILADNIFNCSFLEETLWGFLSYLIEVCPSWSLSNSDWWSISIC